MSLGHPAALDLSMPAARPSDLPGHVASLLMRLSPATDDVITPRVRSIRDVSIEPCMTISWVLLLQLTKYLYI